MSLEDGNYTLDEQHPPVKLMAILGGYREREEKAAMLRAGVLFYVVGIPWGMIEPHEKQAQSNHSQSLERLNQRGGLSAAEAVAILEDKGWGEISRDEVVSHKRLHDMIMAWTKS